MAKKLLIKVGSYTNRDGEKKNRYVEVGALLVKDGNEFALLDPSVSLAGAHALQRVNDHAEGRKPGDRIMCSVFDNDAQGGAPKQQAAPAASAPVDDDVPF